MMVRCANNPVYVGKLRQLGQFIPIRLNNCPTPYQANSLDQQVRDLSGIRVAGDHTAESYINRGIPCV